jgi:hypothetical protein
VFCSCPDHFPLFPCKKKESRDTTKKRESLQKKEKKKKRTGHGRNTQIGSAATPAKTVSAMVRPVHPRVHPSFLFFPSPFALSFLSFPGTCDQQRLIVCSTLFQLCIIV